LERSCCPYLREGSAFLSFSWFGWPSIPQRFPDHEALEKKQVSDLLNDLERVGNAARPEGIPDLIDLTANFAG
jgi:hypothetical protein